VTAEQRREYMRAWRAANKDRIKTYEGHRPSTRAPSQTKAAAAAKAWRAAKKASQ
jgi:hypothetical protein